MGCYVNTSFQDCHWDTHSILFTPSRHARRGRRRQIGRQKEEEGERQSVRCRAVSGESGHEPLGDGCEEDRSRDI